jgi:hypothetical protein
LKISLLLPFVWFDWISQDCNNVLIFVVPPKQSSDKCEKMTLKNTQSNNDTNQLNHLSEPQLFYRLNYLPEFSTKINEGTIKITDIIQAHTFFTQHN